MQQLQGKVALVTGASRGAGRGIALALGAAGATVYVTGRSVRGGAGTEGRAETIDDTAEALSGRGGVGIPVPVDHTVDAQVAALLARIKAEQGRLDILVNNAWGGYEHYNTQQFTLPFWQQPDRWRPMFEAGLRSHLMGCKLAAPLMLGQGYGLLVNTTVAIRAKYHGNLYYDIAKTAINRMSFGMAHDLRPHGVAVVALAPGWMRTEKVLDEFGTDAGGWQSVLDLALTESPEYTGRAVVALATDPEVMERSGQLWETGHLAREYGFTDVDGRQVPPFSESYPDAL